MQRLTSKRGWWVVVVIIIAVLGCLVAKLCDSFQPHGLQAPLSLGFARQEYWSRLPFPSPGDLPDSGIKHEFPALAGKFLTASHQGNPLLLLLHSLNALYSAPGTLLRALQEVSSLSLLTTTEIVGIPPNLAGQTDSPGKLFAI